MTVFDTVFVSVHFPYFHISPIRIFVQCTCIHSCQQRIVHRIVSTALMLRMLRYRRPNPISARNEKISNFYAREDAVGVKWFTSLSLLSTFWRFASNIWIQLLRGNFDSTKSRWAKYSWFWIVIHFSKSLVVSSILRFFNSGMSSTGVGLCIWEIVCQCIQIQMSYASQTYLIALNTALLSSPSSWWYPGSWSPLPYQPNSVLSWKNRNLNLDSVPPVSRWQNIPERSNPNGATKAALQTSYQFRYRTQPFLHELSLWLFSVYSRNSSLVMTWSIPRQNRAMLSQTFQFCRLTMEPLFSNQLVLQRPFVRLWMFECYFDRLCEGTWNHLCHHR